MWNGSLVELTGSIVQKMLQLLKDHYRLSLLTKLILIGGLKSGMNKIFFITLCSFVLLIGCGKETTKEILEEHIQYLDSYGWHVKDKISEKSEVMNYFPERLQTLRIAGLDLEPYKNKELVVTSYKLKEKQKTGKKMYVSIYEYDGKIIGGHGGLEDWDPGLFALTDKERLINEGIMTQ